MIARTLQRQIQAALRRAPCVVLLGPRQVGKTTLALEIAEDYPSLYLDLEDSLDLAKVQDIRSFVDANEDKLIILDEVQRLPEVFQPLRGIIDRRKRAGRKHAQFLMLGSASPDLLRQSGESLAGRVSYLELFPVNAQEYSDPNQLNSLWLRGGFPESLLAETDYESLLWRRDFIRTYLERDVAQLGQRIAATTLERFWTMLAHRQGGIFNASMIGRSLDVSNVTAGRYLDLMVDLLLIRRLHPWTANIGKRLVRSPKVYIRDSGITHALLNIDTINTLLGHPVAGESWEGFVIENILSVTQPHVTPYFYSTPKGAEIDLILEFGAKERWAIEIKRNSTPAINKGFHIACGDIAATRKFMVYAGTDEFVLPGAVNVTSLTGMMRHVETQSR